MNRTILAVGITAAFAFTGCGVTGGETQGPDEARVSFPAPAGDLTIHNEFGRVLVTEADTTEVTVVRTVTAIGKSVSEPEWSLNGNTLTIESACGTGYVGICEPTFRVTVPHGVQVTVAAPQW